MSADPSLPATPLPPAAVSPYPARPAAHPQRDEALEALPKHADASLPANGPAIGGLGVTLIGGAVAVAFGLLLAAPLFRREKTAKATAKPAARTTRAAPRRRTPAKARRRD